MDEPIWIYFSIIAIIVAFVIIISLFNQNQGHLQEQSLSNAFLTLKQHCDFVCDQTPGSIRSVEVDLPSGLLMYTTDDKICGKYESEVRCALCKCNVAPYTLDLNTTETKEIFDIHTFKCYLQREENEIKMDCQG